MSGGVDSSTVAALLVEQGYEVLGITMQLYDHRETADGARKEGTCCSLDDVYDARRVAEQLGIPHFVVNFQEAFQKLVVDNLVEEYLGGRTPNPCVRCNEFMKFRLLLERAVSLGGDFLATGHYARIEPCPLTGEQRLMKAVHADKDQSYFLYPVSQKQLAYMRFPLGHLTKDEVRGHATRFGLSTARKPDSQDVCFIAGESYRQFMERAAGPKLPGEGKVVSVDGLTIGKHEGHHRFTVGQRRGIGLASSQRQYVVAVDPASNTVVVGGDDHLFSSGLVAERFRWLTSALPGPDEVVSVKIRYRSPAVDARVVQLGPKSAHIAFEAPVRAVTPGQSVVVYRGDVVVGGGVIISHSAAKQVAA
jgi:tRNA-specific 2-thiouridylase